jgi:formyltetrahydrofolate hydrolase
MTDNNVTAILLLSCRDRIGLVSRISHFVFKRGGNILDLERLILVRALYYHAQHRILVHGKNYHLRIELSLMT